MQANRTFHVVCLKLQFCSTPTLNALKINSKKRAPWIGPIILVPVGSSKIYLSGTAMKTSIRSEIPSRRPKILKRPMFVLNKCVMIYIIGLNYRK